MKKALSILLALSMILSCVSMMTFVVNAEGTSAQTTGTTVGRRFTLINSTTSTQNPQASAGLTDADVTLVDEVGDGTANTTAKGTITKNYVVYNDGDYPVTITSGYYGGSNGWKTVNGANTQTETLQPGVSQTFTVKMNAYRFTDGTWVQKVASADGTYNDVAGYCSLETVQLRLRLDNAHTAGSTFVVYPANFDTNDAIYNFTSSIFTYATETLPVGVKYNVTTTYDGGSAYLIGPAGSLTKEMANAGTITKNFVIYNTSETEAVTIITRYRAASGSSLYSQTTTIAAGNKATVTINVPCDASGTYDGTNAVSSLQLRFDITGGLTAGNSIIVATENNPEVLLNRRAGRSGGTTGAIQTTNVSELPAEPTPTPDPVAVKLTGTGKTDTLLSETFKGVEIQDGMTVTTVQFAVYSKNALNIRFYPTNGWHQCIYAEPGTKYDSNNLRYGKDLTLAAGEVQIVKLTVPTTYYVGWNETVGSNVTTDEQSRVPYSCTELDIRINYSRALTTDDEVYIAPLHGEDVLGWTRTYGGPAMEKVWDIPFTMPAPEATPAAVFLGAQVDVGSTLTMNYVATVADKCEDPYVVFTRNEKDTTVYGVKQSDGTYLFAYEGINAQCMSDVITAKLYSGNEELATAADYSVRQNAINLYNNTEDTTLKTLLADMLAYGAASQEYTGYNTDNLANAGLNWEETSSFDSAKLLQDGVEREVGTRQDSNNYIKSVGMNISNVYKLYFRFELEDGVNYKVMLNGDNDVTNKVEGGVLYTDDIKATGNATPYTVELYVNEELVHSVSYNVNAYIYMKQDDASVGAIVKAIANYGQSATAYAPNN